MFTFLSFVPSDVLLNLHRMTIHRCLYEKARVRKVETNLEFEELEYSCLFPLEINDTCQGPIYTNYGT